MPRLGSLRRIRFPILLEWHKHSGLGASPSAMKFQHFLERVFSDIVLGIWSLWRAVVTPKASGKPGEGSQGAGVAAKLKPRPPVLSASAAEALPDPGVGEAA